MNKHLPLPRVSKNGKSAITLTHNEHSVELTQE